MENNTIIIHTTKNNFEMIEASSASG